MFLLLDGIEHECCNRFAGQTETHPGRGTLPASIGEVVFLSETRRTGDCPVEPATLHDFFHCQRSRIWFRRIKLTIRLGTPGKCAAAERMTSRFTPERCIARVVASAL